MTYIVSSGALNSTLTTPTKPGEVFLLAELAAAAAAPHYAAQRSGGACTRAAD